ncbi:hypothetical protein SO802_032270 [Lithocarpus litseifolius]|uniref:Uncharacterized protein n=1 Tax=Lithocarpus litseifolius TaxID=425828 RepID=A0AAW2BRA1_9ROSI
MVIAVGRTSSEEDQFITKLKSARRGPGADRGFALYSSATLCRPIVDSIRHRLSQRHRFVGEPLFGKAQQGADRGLERLHEDDEQ